MQKINALNVPTDGLVGMWKGDSSWEDFSGNGNDGVATNVSYVTADNGYQSKLGSFNGSSSRVIIPDDSSLTLSTTYDIIVNYKPTALPSSGGLESLLSKYDNVGNPGGYDLRLYNNGGTQRIDWGIVKGTNNTEIISAVHTLDIGEWNTIRVSGSSTFTRIYVNNELISETTSLGTIADNTKSLYLGAFGTYQGDDLGRYANGQLGTTFVYDKVLNDVEREIISQYYNREMGPSDTDYSVTTSHTFPFYSTPDLKENLVLDISNPAVGGVYYDQS